MRFKLFLILMLVSVPLWAGALNGFAVSTLSRNSNSKLLTPELYVTGKKTLVGKILCYTISNNIVSATDTVYKKTLARFPTWNATGQKIAFYRYNAYQNNGNLIVPDTKVHLSVINRDGTGLIDLVTFDEDGGEDKHMIDWPGNGNGEWIYFITMDRYEIWKVHVSSPGSAVRVQDYPKMRRNSHWSLNLGGNKAVFLNADCNGANNGRWCIIPHTFPFKENPTYTGFSAECFEGCHPYISASGNYMTHFFNAGHNALRINRWNSNHCEETWQISLQDMSSLYPNAEFGSRFRDIRMACNSDKWICAETAVSDSKGGANQVLINWKDNSVVKVTDHALRSDDENAILWGNSPGDLYVEGPAGQFQNADDSWSSINSISSIQHSQDISILKNLHGKASLVIHLNNNFSHGKGSKGAWYTIRGTRVTKKTLRRGILVHRLQ